MTQTNGKKTTAENQGKQKGNTKGRAKPRKADVARDVKPKTGKKAKATPTKAGAPPRGMGKTGMRRPDAWAAILANLEVNKVYSRDYLNKQMVKQYKTGSVPNHHWWVGIYTQLCLALGMMAKVDDGYLYVGLGGIPAPDTQEVANG